MSFDLALIENDLKLLPNGDIKTVSDTTKLRQDILKIILTSLGSNRFHPWYGCSVGDDIIGKNLPQNLLDLGIQTSVSQSLERLKKLQLQQQTNQHVTLAELINTIGPIFSYRAPEDPRQIKIDVTVFTRRLTEIRELFTLEA